MCALTFTTTRRNNNRTYAMVWWATLRMHSQRHYTHVRRDGLSSTAGAEAEHMQEMQQMNSKSTTGAEAGTRARLGARAGTESITSARTRTRAGTRREATPSRSKTEGSSKSRARTRTGLKKISFQVFPNRGSHCARTIVSGLWRNLLLALDCWLLLVSLAGELADDIMAS